MCIRDSTYLVDQLGRFQKEDVLVRAADAVAEVVGTKDVAIYKVSNADYARLLVSVSYTHLDVYKRQAARSAPYSVEASPQMYSMPSSAFCSHHLSLIHIVRLCLAAVCERHLHGGCE